MAWKPIETAPRDGTQLLLYWNELIPPVFVGSFCYTDIPKDHEDYWEGWLFSEEILLNASDIDLEPTHWMPISPPLIEEGEEEAAETLRKPAFVTGEG